MSKFALLFDLDGTLWTVLESTTNAAQKISNKYGLPLITEEQVAFGMGKTKEENAMIYFPTLSLEEGILKLDEVANVNIDNILSNGARVYDNVVETLNDLKNDYDLYIVSNSARKDYLKAFTKTSKTESIFKDLVAAGELNLTKGEAIKKVINDNNLDSIIYIGDTSKDQEAAEYANIPFIYCSYGFGKDVKYDYRIDNFAELKEIVKNIK